MLDVILSEVVRGFHRQAVEVQVIAFDYCAASGSEFCTLFPSAVIISLVPHTVCFTTFPYNFPLPLLSMYDAV